MCHGMLCDTDFAAGSRGQKFSCCWTAQRCSHSAQHDGFFAQNSKGLRYTWACNLLTILNYSKTTRNILFIDVSASRRKPSSGLTSGAGRQYVKACPIRGSVGSSPRLDSCSPSSWSILPPLYVCHLCLILGQSRSCTTKCTAVWTSGIWT